MAEITMKSAGVSTREIDLTGETSVTPTGIPAGIISPTEKGPAFVPVTVPTMDAYTIAFGEPVEDLKYGPLAANEWLTSKQALTQIKVLGAGDGTPRISSGNNKGSVNYAGFVVGQRQPQTSLTGNLGNNVYAVSESVRAAAEPGRAYFLGCFMSESAGSTYFRDAGISAGTAAILRGIVFAASGVVLTLSGNTTALGNDLETPCTGAAVGSDWTNVLGGVTGSVNISGSKQEFVMLLNGHIGLDSQYPNIITASFDPGARNYFGTIFNKDPYNLEQAGHYLYAHWDIDPAVAVITGVNYVLPESGSGALSIDYEQDAFIITGSAGTNSGSTTQPNYENFEDRFKAASTPWFISQKFGGNPANLFKVYALDTSDYTNGKLKVSIENITPSSTTADKYGTFDLVVRDFNDSDNKKVVLEQFRGLSLNEKSDRYIGKIIGDTNTFFDFDASEGQQRLITEGDYSSQSKYIRVELSQELKDGNISEEALPVGFRGPQHLVTSGTAPMAEFSDTSMYSVTNPLDRTLQPPIPFRKNLAKGVSPNQTADKNLYWGVQFEQVISVTELNSTTAQNTSIASYTKYFPDFQTEWMNFAVRDNEGTADTAADSILDADRFNNNLFTLENIRIKYNTTTNLPDTNNLYLWAYARTGSIAPDPTNGYRALAVTDLLDSATRTVGKFTVWLEGGFSGARIFDRDCYTFSNKAATEELDYSARGLSNGPTVKSYMKALEIIKDTSEVDVELLVVPGIRVPYLTDEIIRATEVDRGDAVYIMDIEERDTSNNKIRSDTQKVSVQYTANNFRNRGLNSSYTAAYFPDVEMADNFNRTIEKVPPSVVVLGAFGKNDAMGYPWTAPAGFSRASLTSVNSVSVLLSRANLDELYAVSINPLATFPGEGPVVWGQKNLLAKTSLLSRVSVRRLLITLKRELGKVANKIIFEQGKVETLNRFADLCQPVMKRVKDLGGVEIYKVDISTKTTTQADIENKTIRGKIYLVPINALEFVSLDFVLTNAGVTIS